MFLTLIDSHIKWMEIFSTTTATSAIITKQRWSLLIMDFHKLMSQTMAHFTSQEFESFLKLLEIQHIKTAPYHPQSNGMAEHCVQFFKEKYKQYH